MDIKDFERPALKATYSFALLVIQNSVQKLWPNLDWFSWPLLAAGIIMLIWAAFDTIFIRLKWRIFQEGRRIKFLIPLNYASEKAYDILRNTYWHGVAKLQVGDKDDPRGAYTGYARLIADSKNIYGAEVPSKKLICIVKSDNTAALIEKYGACICNIGGGVIYENLMVERKQFKAFLKERRPS